jgi:hypothetical protein
MAMTSRLLDLEKVQNLPLNGRQVYMLLGLTRGTKFTQTQLGAGGYSGIRGWDTSNVYSITGQPETNNHFMLSAPLSVQRGASEIRHVLGRGRHSQDRRRHT